MTVVTFEDGGVGPRSASFLDESARWDGVMPGVGSASHLAFWASAFLSGATRGEQHRAPKIMAAYRTTWRAPGSFRLEEVPVATSVSREALRRRPARAVCVLSDGL
jgi:hypothetical protein